MSGINVPAHYGPQYSSNLQLLLQQKMAKLRAHVMTGSHKGSGAQVVNQVGSIEMQKVVSRFQPMGRVDSPLTSRWVFPEDYDLPQLLDHFDELRLLMDPKSKYVENAHLAANRVFDRIINKAFFENAKTGSEGKDTTVFKASNIIAAGGTGLTVAKLKAVQAKMLSMEIDLEAERPVVAVTSAEHTDLLNEIQIISSDYSSKPVLEDGKIRTFLGMDFLHYEKAAQPVANTNRIPVWVKSGMYLGVWEDMKTDISQRKDLQGLPWQAYVYLTAGATRTDEDKVFAIDTYHAP